MTQTSADNDAALSEQELAARARRMRRVPWLFANVLVISVCGLIYELLSGAVASYLLGDSVTQFSLVIGLYLSAMGVGAWLSRFLENDLARRFVEVELAVALTGGLSAPVLFYAFSRMFAFRPLLFLEVFVVGVLVGLELPILMRILEKDLNFKDLVSRVLTFDYIGALVASLLFPLVFVPHLGLVRSAFAAGIVNALVALWGTELLKDKISGGHVGLQLRALVVIALLAVGFIKADTLTIYVEENLYADAILYTKTTPYQRIVVTGGKTGFSVFLNGNLQFSSADEYRYHEALVHPAMATATSHTNILVLGGGDGLALREILKYDDVAHVTLIDIDAGMTGLGAEFPPLAELNRKAFSDARVVVKNEDAFVYLNEGVEALRESFDVIIVDFPDPNHFSLGKLYTRRMYQLMRETLKPDGAIVVQSTSPLLARKSFWTIVNTMEFAGFVARPYHATVPSFGVWGYVLAKKSAFEIPTVARSDLRFLNSQSVASMFVMPSDMSRLDGLEVNRLDNQALVLTYEHESSLQVP